MASVDLSQWGWGSDWEVKLPSEKTDYGRIVEESRDQYQVLTSAGIVLAEVTGQFRYRAKKRSDYPVVGDWVVLEQRAGSERNLITDILPRKSKVGRKSAGEKDEEQPLASNIDWVALVSSYSRDFNLRRMERFFSVVMDAQVQPMLILSKADLLEDQKQIVQELEKQFPQIKIMTTSVVTGEGLAELENIFAHKSVLLLGVSGAGKSSLTNALMQQTVQATQEIREKDARGRHTTTRRSLFKTPFHACLIDTPGIRELQIFDSDVDVAEVFAEIAEHGAHCRFADCTHRNEPGCAVIEALSSGKLEEDRYQSYLKLSEEVASNDQKYDRLKEKKSRDEKNKLKGRSLRKNKSWKQDY